MKVPSTAAAIALAACVVAVQSTECTDADFDKFYSMDEAALSKACGDDASTNYGNWASFCASSDCIKFIKVIAAKAPDCEVAGMSLQAAMKIALDACNGDFSSALTLVPNTSLDLTEKPSASTKATLTELPKSTTATTTAPPKSSDANSLACVGAAAALGVAATWWMADA